MLRLIPSKFPPIGLFDTVATRADIDAVLDLSGWSNDRLVPGRLARIMVFRIENRCEFRRNPATDSDLMPATVPKRSRPPFRDESGHLSC